MAFTVEDGTGLAGSNSYLAVAGADAYHSERGNDQGDWDGSTAEKQQALVKATDFIDRRWGHRFGGKRLLKTQALRFPRQKLYNPEGTLIEGIPTQLENACAEYAMRILAGTTLAPDPESHDSERSVKRDKIKVGPIELESELGGRGPRPFPDADRWLVDFVVASGGGVIRN